MIDIYETVKVECGKQWIAVLLNCALLQQTVEEVSSIFTKELGE